MSKITILSGSPSISSRLSGALQWTQQHLTTRGHTVYWVNVRDLPPDGLLHARFEHPAIQNAHQAIADAHGIIVASPVYKASYTGLLKSYLDMLPQDAFAEKVIFPLMIGGSPAHLLALEYTLKPVCSILGARHLLQGVYVLESDVTRNGQDDFQLTAAIKTRLSDAAEQLLDELQRLRTNTQATISNR